MCSSETASWWPTGRSRNYLQADKGVSGTIRFPIRFAIVNGDLALWPAPVELFREISMKVGSRSSFHRPG